MYASCQCDEGFYTPQEDKQLQECDASIAYIQVGGGVFVVPSERGRGSICIDQDECKAQQCAKKALDCLETSQTLVGCDVNTTLPNTTRLTRLWTPPKNASQPNQAAGHSQAKYFGTFVRTQPCESNSVCWNSIGSYQCVCNEGYARVNGSNGCNGQYVHVRLFCPCFMQACVCVCICLCLCLCLYLLWCAYIYTYMHVCAGVRGCTYTCRWVQRGRMGREKASIHAYKHTHTHTHIYTQRSTSAERGHGQRKIYSTSRGASWCLYAPTARSRMTLNTWTLYTRPS